ncbi:hypothetical protein EVAR_82833_1 [Eumeta japonica]|uniref:Uncharacterized protein n=1 Tax=Eumeta variegata TaxID=151549 RepID=A0A4C1V435_EUMVA|nr:hypothetical protein EVAR_82833_1 [Eumeta japonica]
MAGAVRRGGRKEAFAVSPTRKERAAYTRIGRRCGRRAAGRERRAGRPQSLRRRLRRPHTRAWRGGERVGWRLLIDISRGARFMARSRNTCRLMNCTSIIYGAPSTAVD